MDRVCDTHARTHTHTHREDMGIASKILVKICEGNRPVVTGTSYTQLAVSNK